jgi:hypothetical protein
LLGRLAHDPAHDLLEMFLLVVDGCVKIHELSLAEDQLSYAIFHLRWRKCQRCTSLRSRTDVTPTYLCANI